MISFKEAINKKLLSNKSINTMQLNITRKCNLACKHCHVEASPSRTEDMSLEIAKKCLEVFKELNFKILDITGGAPEMSKSFRYLIEEGSKIADKVLLRSNLTVHELEEFECFEFIRNHNVELICSLPFYEEDRVDKQRGIGVFENSIDILKKLNDLGYGRDAALNLVYNPSGALLPSNQEDLERIYREKLKEEYGIIFNDLYVITNMPIGRFKGWLERSNNYNRYMDRLYNSMNLGVLDSVMCRDMISVDYDGTVYDCDFNLALGLKMDVDKANIFEIDEDIFGRKIKIGNHCYACIAGSGSS